MGPVSNGKIGEIKCKLDTAPDRVRHMKSKTISVEEVSKQTTCCMEWDSCRELGNNVFKAEGILRV